MAYVSFPRFLGVLLLCGSSLALAQDEPPFGDEKAVRYAEKLWSHLTELNLVGKNRTLSAPYEGVHPHGSFLDMIERSITLDDNTGPVIIKRNYAGDDASKRTVWNNPEKYLATVTVMYQREGYDPDNNNWFWVQYYPDGSLTENPQGMKLAGRVGADIKAGCIACHQNAPGGDLVYAHDRYDQNGE